jgi:rod shape-determining protein MreC
MNRVYLFLSYLIGRFLFWILLVFSVMMMIFCNKDNRLNNLTIEIFSLGIRPVEELLCETRKYMSNIYDLFYAHEQNIILKTEIEKLKLAIQDKELTQAENNRLKDLLYFIPDKKFTYKTARLLSISTTPYVKTGIIAAGSNNGIEQNQILVGIKGVIGRIIEVSANSSKILLITDYNSRIPVITANSRERAIASGNNGEFLDLIHMNKNSQIREGELVLTSGDGQFYPAGLVIGRISSIQDGKVSIEPLLEPHKLELVLILTK